MKDFVINIRNISCYPMRTIFLRFNVCMYIYIYIYILVCVFRVCNFKWIRNDEQKLRVYMTRTEKPVVGDYIDCCDGHEKVI
jgi:hypothetical protein